jgi:hypothetical protein
MRKLIGRLIGFVVFLFACLFVGLLVLGISTGVVDLHKVFPNLPEPPEIDARGLPPVGVSTPELPGVELPEELQPGEAVPLRGKVTRRPLVAGIPAPQQLVTAPPVLGTNIFLAILMALIFGVTSTVLGNMLRDEEPRIQAWLKAVGIQKLVARVGRAFSWTLGGRVKQGCLSLPLVALIIALYGIIFAALERGTSILSREGVFLAVAMAFSVGLVSFSGDIARRILARLWREKSRFNLYPANLFVAVLTVVFSRLLNLSPGVVFGTPGGADVDIPAAKRERREVILSFATLVVLATVGGIGWFVSGWVLTMLDAPIAARLVDTVAGILTPVQNTGLILFMVALETLFFESLPLAYGTGRTIFRWNKVVWGVIFVPIAFLFNHTLLNPQSGFLDSFFEPNVYVLWALIFALVGFTAALWFYFNVLDDMLREAFGVELP